MKDIKDLVGQVIKGINGEDRRIIAARFVGTTAELKTEEVGKINKFGQRSLNSLKGIHPDLVKVMTESVKYSPIDFTITDGLRTTAQQQALYAKGRTTSGSKVTNADGVKNKSNHQAKTDGFGYAVDLYAYYDGKVQVNDDKTIINKIAPHIKQVAKNLGINIEWGGDWKSFKDYPHFELKK